MRVLWCVLCVAGCVWDHDRTAGGATITDIAIMQGPAIPLVQDGAATLVRNAPVLAGRPGRITATVELAGGAEPRGLTIRFELGTTILDGAIAVPGGPAAVARDVTVDFDGSAITAGTTLVATVIEQNDFVSSLDQLAGVRQPVAGALPLDARIAPRFRVTVVPVTTGTTGAPAIDQARLDRWRQTLVALMPITDADLTVAEPLDTGRDISTTDGWTAVLADLAARRAAANTDPDTFYYGVVAGYPLSMIGGIAATTAVEVPYWRVAAGMLAGDPVAEETVVAHELGHALGRSHAPCGNPAGPDYGYPYPGASIGVSGLDLRDRTVRAPDKYVDFMSYCTPVFVSDYQFGALYDSLSWLGTRSHATDAPTTFTADPRLDEVTR